MAVGESPAVARHRLRLALREAREAKGLTQREVARSLDWSLSKINRIEGGEVTLSRTDLLALLELLAVTDPDRVQDLIDDARTARRRGWWDRPQYREHLTAAMIQSVQFEAEAGQIRSFQPTLIPGVLQTPAYTSALVDFWSEELSAAGWATRTEIRRWRRKQLFDASRRLKYLLVLDETVLLREVGGPGVMADQLYDLLNLIHTNRIMVRVTPLSHATALIGMFTIYTNDGRDMATYREAYLYDQIAVSPESVGKYRRMFEVIWPQAMSTEASVHLIEARAAAMRSAVDRRRTAG
jgi:transcriptional regulator with XRE-family HTH domain